MPGGPTDTFLTLADLVKINDLNVADYDITDLLQEAPFLARLAADVASNGTTHKYLKETGAANVGFRAVNTGVVNTVSADTVVTVNLSILDASFVVDKALAMGYRKGAAAFVARELGRHIRAAYFAAETQFINGTTGLGGLANGFAGLADVMLLANPMTLNAGGTTAATATSVYLVRTNGDGSDAMAVTGRDGQLTVGDTIEQAIADTVNGGRYTGLYTSVIGWLALQLGSKYSVGRICNVTDDTGKGVTDDLLYSALSLFPAAKQPNMIVMNRRALKQLRHSRTTFNPTGLPAPRPTDLDGIPIVVVESIGNAETIVAA